MGRSAAHAAWPRRPKLCYCTAVAFTVLVASAMSSPRSLGGEPAAVASLGAVPLVMTPAKRRRPAGAARVPVKTTAADEARVPVKAEVSEEGTVTSAPSRVDVFSNLAPSLATPVKRSQGRRVKQEPTGQRLAVAVPHAVVTVDDSDADDIDSSLLAVSPVLVAPKARAVRKARGRGGRTARARGKAAVPAVPAKSGGDLRAAVLALGTAVFLEVFSGSARLTSAMLAAGVAAFGVDILEGYDVVDPDVRGAVLDLIREGVLVGLWLGTPCQGLGRARRGRSWLDRQARGGRKSGWPAAIRGPNNVWGLPRDELSPKDAVALETSNRLVHASLEIFQACRDASVPVAMENPKASYLWLLPEAEALWKDVDGAARVSFDFCAYGTPWKKSTTLLFHGWQGVHVLERRCHARRTAKGRPSLCQYTMCEHKHLTGIDRESKKWRTSVAQPYPVPLCEAVVRVFQAMP